MGKTAEIASLIIFNLFFLFFIVAIFIFIRQYSIKKKEHLDTIYRQNIEHQKEILATQLEMQQQTMQEIGQEIHDNIGQKLTLASIYAQQITTENKSTEINNKIENISQIIKESLVELRQLSKSLTDNGIEKTDISKLIAAECNKTNQLKICKVHFAFEGEKIKLSYQIKSVLVRISQEFLQNSIKHSNCKNIDVQLENKNNNLVLSIKDDGIGFDILKNNQNGIGLKNMETRTKMIGGTYFLESKINIGTHLSISIPS